MEPETIKPTSVPCNDLRRGFTLTELLVVIGIIILLVGLLMPMVSKAYREGERNRVRADLQTISSALESFKQDHGHYPPDGRDNLGRWLISPGDDGDTFGANDHDTNNIRDPGFRVRAGAGKVWGPYLQADKWKFVGTAIQDRYRKPVLYYLANQKANVNVAEGYVSATAAQKPRYFTGNNSEMPLNSLRMLLGDVNPTNGRIDPAETGIMLPFLLISAGPDEMYGPQADTSGVSTIIDHMDVQKCDDVTNFR